MTGRFYDHQASTSAAVRHCRDLGPDGGMDKKYLSLA